jgi:hypothetical protein
MIADIFGEGIVGGVSVLGLGAWDSIIVGASGLGGDGCNGQRSLDARAGLDAERIGWDLGIEQHGAE